MAWRKRKKKGQSADIKADTNMSGADIKTDTNMSGVVDVPVRKARRREVNYICADCGSDLKVQDTGPYHPRFCSRKYRCTGCGRQTDYYVTERRDVAL